MCLVGCAFAFCMGVFVDVFVRWYVCVCVRVCVCVAACCVNVLLCRVVCAVMLSDDVLVCYGGALWLLCGVRVGLVCAVGGHVMVC